MPHFASELNGSAYQMHLAILDKCRICVSRKTELHEYLSKFFCRRCKTTSHGILCNSSGKHKLQEVIRATGL